MAENYELYVSSRNLISNAQIREAAGGSKVHFYLADDTHTAQPNWVRCEIRWPEGVATINRLEAREPEFADHVRDFRGRIHPGGDEEIDERLQGICAKIDRARTVFIISAPPECADRLEVLARGFAGKMHGLLSDGSSIWDSQGRLCQATDGSFHADAGWDTPPSALERKARSEARLQQACIPVPDCLPVIEGDDEAVIQPPWEVARRACALVTAAGKAEGWEHQKALQYLQGWHLWEAASPREQAFLLNPSPPEPERIQFLWKYECLWVMLWALGHVEALGAAAQVCDVRRAVRTVFSMSPEQFISQSNLRPVAEILDEADFIYRCHTAIENARIRNEDPLPGLNAGVVLQRHIALNWLRCYRHQNWDDVTADI